MTLPRAPSAVVFDMDGLLIDTETAARETFLEVTALGGHDVPLEVYLRMVGTSGGAGRDILKAHFGETADVEALWDAWGESFDARLEAGVALKDGVIELLDHLDALRLPRAIATSSPRRHVQHNLSYHGLHDRFTAVIAQGDYARGKPAPDPFLKAAEALGVPPHACLALEDSHNGVRAAHAAGMMTVMVPDLLDPTEEIRGLCVRIADSLHEVRDLFGGGGAA